MPWMVKWAGPFPPYVESAEGAHFRCVDGHDYVDFCLGDTGAMAGHGPAPTIAAVEAPDPPRHHPHAPDRRRGLGRRGADPAVRRRFVAVRALGQRCQPLGPAPGPPHHRPVQGRRPRPLLPRVGRRGDRDAGARRRRRAGPRLGRSPGRRRPDDPRRRVQRCRRTRGRAGRRRRRGRPVRARPDQRRHRPARARLPRCRPRHHAPDGDAPGHRRDPHHLRRPRRGDRCLGPRARHRRHRQDDRRRHPVGRLRLQPRGRRPHPRLDRGRGFGRRRDRWDAGRLRAVAGGHPGHPRRGPDRRCLRAHDPARRALGGGCQRRARASAASRGT